MHPIAKRRIISNILTPNINFVTVVRAAKYELRRPVVSAYYVRRIQTILLHYLSRPKVTNLNNTLFVS